jgi:tetrahydromethanopterin S-methyltransferase subunit G
MTKIRLVDSEFIQDYERRDCERLDRIENKIDNVFSELAILLAKRIEYKEKEKHVDRTTSERT